MERRTVASKLVGGALAAGLLATTLSPGGAFRPASAHAAGAPTGAYHGAYIVQAEPGANTAPTVEVGPDAELGAGGTLRRLGSFADPDTADTWTATVDYGDGSGVQPLALAGAEFELDHAYAAAGAYTLSVSVSDSQGGVGTDTLTVAVSEAAGYTRQFVTGGGMIFSPAGACALTIECAQETGRAEFAFGSKYSTRTHLPYGKVQFRFKAGDLRFRSTEIDSLAITGARAEIEAQGTVNRAGSYTIRVTALDGAVAKQGAADKRDRSDRLRIEITDNATGAVVYDTQAGAPDTAAPAARVKGSIKIHRLR